MYISASCLKLNLTIQEFKIMSHRYFINKWHASNYRIDLEGQGICGKIEITIKPFLTSDSVMYEMTIKVPNCEPDVQIFKFSHTIAEFLEGYWKVKCCRDNLLQDLLSLITF
jgi:hypothetical protein